MMYIFCGEEFSKTVESNEYSTMMSFLTLKYIYREAYFTACKKEVNMWCNKLESQVLGINLSLLYNIALINQGSLYQSINALIHNAPKLQYTSALMHH